MLTLVLLPWLRCREMDGRSNLDHALSFKRTYTLPQLFQHLDKMIALLSDMTEGSYQHTATKETIGYLKAAILLYEKELLDGS